MDGRRVIRLAWGVFALPLSFISLIVAMATWPAVFGNTPIRLFLIAYIIALPAVPAFVSLENRSAMVLLGMVTVAAQVAVFGKLNLWF